MSTLNRRAALTSREVQTAVRLNLLPEIARHAVAEGTKAVTKYRSNKGGPSSLRTGLKFPVTFCCNQLKTRSGLHIGKGAGVYLTAVLEYLCAEVLELSGNAARASKKKRIVPRHVMIAVHQEEELHRLFKGTIPHAGVVPSIFKELLPQPVHTSNF